MKSSCFFPKRQAFTLVELLVVVGIVTIVVALAVPMGTRMRSGAQAAKCVNNLRTIYAGTLSFVQDHGGLLPPCQGPAAHIDPEFIYNNYWWQQPYLARYVVGPLNRPKDSRGALSQAEAEIYNCPARFQDGPDERYRHSNGAPALSYVMTRLVTANCTRNDFLLYAMEGKSRRIFITEGRGYRIVPVNAVTGEMNSGDTQRRIRRFHNQGVNLLFYDGHIEHFTGPDSELQSMVR